MKKQALFILVCAALCGAGLTAESTPSPALLVLSKRDLTLSIVNPATLQVVAKTPSGPDPHEVVASSDGKFAYISNYGFGTYNTITIVDLIAQKTLKAVDLGALRGPHGLFYAGGKVYFTAETNQVIGTYDPATDKVDWILGTGQERTHMVWVSADLQRIVTTNVNAATVSVIEKRTPAAGAPPGPPRPAGPSWTQTVVPVGKGDEGFDVSPDGREIWTANAQDGTISIIDFATKRVSATLNADVASANRLKFAPDGKLVLVSMLRSPEIVILDASTRGVVKRLKVGTGAAGIEMQPDGTRAFVACTPDNYVAVIDLKTLDVSVHIDAGGGPDGMAWAVH